MQYAPGDRIEIILPLGMEEVSKGDKGTVVLWKGGESYQIVMDNNKEIVVTEEEIKLLPSSPLENQIGGSHYKDWGMYQPWNVLAERHGKERFIGAIIKDVDKYTNRSKDNQKQDWEKAMHTIQIGIEIRDRKGWW